MRCSKKVKSSTDRIIQAWKGDFYNFLKCQGGNDRMYRGKGRWEWWNKNFRNIRISSDFRMPCEAGNIKLQNKIRTTKNIIRPVECH